MKKIFILLIATMAWLHAFEVYTPVQEIKVKGMSKDMVLDDNKLIIGTTEGAMQVYDYESKAFVKTLTFPEIKDFMGDIINPRVFSVDKIEGRYVILSDSGKGGYANLWIHENNVTTQILDAGAKKAVVKARFINKDQILFGYLSNEAALFDLKSKEEIYRVQLSESKFSDFALNEDRSRAVFSCESGILNIIDTKTGKVVKVLEGMNLDNVYRVDFKKDIVSGAGQDRRGSIYDTVLGSGTYIEAGFLIYATGLSPSAKKVAFVMDEQNNISIYNRSSKTKVAELQGQKSTLNNIIFKDENTLFSSSDDNTVLMWRIK